MLVRMRVGRWRVKVLWFKSIWDWPVRFARDRSRWMPYTVFEIGPLSVVLWRE